MKDYEKDLWRTMIGISLVEYGISIGKFFSALSQPAIIASQSAFIAGMLPLLVASS